MISLLALFFRLFSIKKAILCSLVTLILSDVILMYTGMYTFSWGWVFTVYVTYAVVCGVAFLLYVNQQKRKRLTHIMLYDGVALPCLFWIVTNAFVWFSGVLYPLTGAGLLQCFTLALPFLPALMMANSLGAFLFHMLFGATKAQHDKLQYSLALKAS